MWGVAGVIAAALAIFFADGLGLWKQRKLRDFWVFTALLAIGAGLAVAETLQMRVPNPLDGIRFLFEPAGRWVLSLLETNGK